MRFGLIRAEKVRYPAAMTCRLLGVSRSGFCAWCARPPCAREADDERLRVHVRAVHRRSRRTYGYPRVHRELRAAGHRIGRHRVARLMREEGLRSVRRRRFRVKIGRAHV